MTSAVGGGEEGGPQKADERNKTADFCMRQGGRGSKIPIILRTSYKYRQRRYERDRLLPRPEMHGCTGGAVKPSGAEFAEEKSQAGFFCVKCEKKNKYVQRTASSFSSFNMSLEFHDSVRQSVSQKDSPPVWRNGKSGRANTVQVSLKTMSE